MIIQTFVLSHMKGLPFPLGVIPDDWRNGCLPVGAMALCACVESVLANVIYHCTNFFNRLSAPSTYIKRGLAQSPRARRPLLTRSFPREIGGLILTSMFACCSRSQILPGTESSTLPSSMQAHQMPPLLCARCHQMKTLQKSPVP